MSLPDFIFTLQIDDDFICDDLMAYYERHNEYKQKGQSNGGDKTSTDVVVYPNSTDPAILQYYGFLKYALEKYKEKYQTLSFPLGDQRTNEIIVNLLGIISLPRGDSV